jgi:hypothetical protein
VASVPGSIERGLAADLGGTALIGFEPTGVTCTIDASLSAPNRRAARWLIVRCGS